MIFPDDTDQTKLKRLLGRTRRHDPSPDQVQVSAGYRDIPVDRIIEYPSFRDSAESYFVQVADLVAFLLYRSPQAPPCARRAGSRTFVASRHFLLTQAASSDQRGIVRLCRKARKRGLVGPRRNPSSRSWLESGFRFDCTTGVVKSSGESCRRSSEAPGRGY